MRGGGKSFGQGSRIGDEERDGLGPKYEFAWVVLLIDGMFSRFCFPFGELRWLFYPNKKSCNIFAVTAFIYLEHICDILNSLVHDPWNSLLTRGLSTFLAFDKDIQKLAPIIKINHARSIQYSRNVNLSFHHRKARVYTLFSQVNCFSSRAFSHYSPCRL